MWFRGEQTANSTIHPTKTSNSGWHHHLVLSRCAFFYLFPISFLSPIFFFLHLLVGCFTSFIFFPLLHFIIISSNYLRVDLHFLAPLLSLSLTLPPTFHSNQEKKGEPRTVDHISV
ncbi:hypothetical protein BKA81DRAFT_344718 [Phyllosticta paracitricarpa]